MHAVCNVWSSPLLTIVFYFLHMSTEKEVWEDLIRCSVMYTEYNNTSHHYKIIMKRLHLMQEYIPAKFSAHFRNPCWYDFHQRPTGPLIYNKDCIVPHQNNQSLAENVLRQARTSSERHLYCLPSFFVPGFPKCATSALFKTIIQHPLVAASRCKEGKFWKRFVIERGTDLDIQIRPLWYLNMLFHAVPYIESNPLSITLDASSTYAHSYHEGFCLVPTLLKRVLPEAKFILIMRNPSKRYFSHYWFKSALLSFESKSELSQYAHSTKGLKDFHDRTVQAIEWFRTCVDHGNSVMSCVLLIDQPVNVSHFLHHSLYYYHIVPWLKIFPRERFLFLRTEDLANDLSSTMSKVWQFLNLNDVPSERVLKNVDTVIQDLSLPQETKVLLDEFYRPHNQLLANLLSDTRYLWND